MSFLTDGTVGVSSFTLKDFLKAFVPLTGMSLLVGSQCGFDLVVVWMTPAFMMAAAFGYWLRRGGHGSLLLALLFGFLGALGAAVIVGDEGPEPASCGPFLERMQAIQNAAQLR